MGAGEILTGVGQALMGTSNTLLNLQKLQEQQKIQEEQSAINKERLYGAQMDRHMNKLKFGMSMPDLTARRKFLKTEGRDALVGFLYGGTMNPKEAEFNDLFSLKSPNKSLVSDDMIDMIAGKDTTQEFLNALNFIIANKGKEGFDLNVLSQKLTENLGKGDRPFTVEGFMGTLQAINSMTKEQLLTKKTKAEIGETKASTALKKAQAGKIKFASNEVKQKDRNAILKGAVNSLINSGQLQVDPITGKVTKGQGFTSVLQKLNTTLRLYGHDPVDANDPKVIENVLAISSGEAESVSGQQFGSQKEPFDPQKPLGQAGVDPMQIIARLPKQSQQEIITRAGGEAALKAKFASDATFREKLLRMAGAD